MRTLCVPAEELTAALELGEFDMAVVMSHHLASDRSYLTQLADTDIAYVGLLDRRTVVIDCYLKSVLPQRKSTVGCSDPPDWRSEAGGPAAIALSIIAQMQQSLRVD